MNQLEYKAIEAKLNDQHASPLSLQEAKCLESLVEKNISQVYSRESKVNDYIKNTLSNNFHVHRNLDSLKKFLKSEFKNRQNIKMLDCGAGTGNFLYNFKDDTFFKVYNLDYCQQMADVWKNKGLPEDDFIISDLNNIPFKNNSLEFISYRYVLHHIPYFVGLDAGITKHLKYAKTKLAENGFIYIKTKYSKKDKVKIYKSGSSKGMLFQSLSKNSIKQTLKNLGFQIITIEIYSPKTHKIGKCIEILAKKTEV